MKHFIITVIIAGIFSCLIQSCAKSDLKIADNSCVKGKIIRVDCEAAIIQILTPGLNIGDSIWEDRHGAMPGSTIFGTFTNVLKAVNLCNIKEHWGNTGIPIGDTIYFDLRIVDSSYRENYAGCNYCTAVDFDEPVKRAILENITLTDCNLTPLKHK